MLARYDAVDDPLVGLLLRLAAHPHAAFIFTIFLFALWNLSQYNYALFAGFVFQPSPQQHQTVKESPRARRPRGRLKFHYLPGQDDNIMVCLQDACCTWALCWIQLVPVLLVSAWGLVVGLPAPCSSWFTWAGHPFFWTYFSIQLLISCFGIIYGSAIALASKQNVRMGENIQSSLQKSTRVISIKHSWIIRQSVYLLNCYGLSTPRAVHFLHKTFCAMRPAVRDAIMGLMILADDYI